MRRDIFILGIIIVLFGLFLLTIFPPLISSYVAQTEPLTKEWSFDVPALNKRYIILSLEQGDKVHIKMRISGGNNDIEFYIKDPSGTYVRSPSKIYSYYEYSFTAGSSGTYELWFDNSFSLLTSKNIYLELTIKPEATLLQKTYSIITPIGVLIMIIGVVIVGIGIVSKPRK